MPMGIWAMWVPVGGLLMYAFAPALAEAAGWRAAWWLAAAVRRSWRWPLWVGVLATGLPPRTAGAGRDRRVRRRARCVPRSPDRDIGCSRGPSACSR